MTTKQIQSNNHFFAASVKNSFRLYFADYAVGGVIVFVLLSKELYN